jgi:hypothetical protein
MNSVFSIRACVAAAAIAAMSLTTSAFAQEANTEKKVAVAKPVARAVAKPTKVRPLSVNIDLIGKTKIAGTLTDTSTLEMRTAFGIANIPLSEVAGIRLASADNASTTVVMLNGDSITGATDIKLMTVETEWGTATINGQNISSVLFVPGLTWNPQSGLNGKRWNLANTKTAPKPAPTTANRSPSTATRSSNGRVQYPNGTPQPAYRGR